MEPGCVGCAIDRWPDVAVALGACFRHARLPRPQTDRGGAGADVTGSDVGDVHLARLSLTAVSAVSPGAYLPAAVGTPSPSQLPARPRAFRCNFSGSGWCGVVRVARRAPCQKVGDRGGAGGQAGSPAPPPPRRSPSNALCPRVGSARAQTSRMPSASATHTIIELCGAWPRSGRAAGRGQPGALPGPPGSRPGQASPDVVKWRNWARETAALSVPFPGRLRADLPRPSRGKRECPRTARTWVGAGRGGEA